MTQDKLKLSSVRMERALRFKQFRTEHYGDRGRAALARDLKIPVTTVANYERGVCDIPMRIVGELSGLKRLNPRWLFHGKGEQCLPPGSPERAARDAADFVGGLLDENEILKAQIAELKYAPPPLTVREGAAGYRKGALNVWEVAAIQRSGKTLKIRKITDAPPPLSIYTGEEDEAEFV